MSDAIKGITIVLDGETTKLQKALKSVNSTIYSTQSSLRQVNSLLKLDPSNVNLLKQKQELLTSAIESTKSKLETEKTALQQLKEADQTDTVKEQQKALADEIAKTESKLNSLETQYKEFGSVAAQQIAVVGEKMEAIGNKMSSIGTTLSTTVTLPLVALGTKAVSSFAEVDETMTLVNQTMSNTTEEANLLNDAMKEAAANSTFGMDDAATASLNFARAGLSAEQAASSLAPAMNLAAGEGGELDTVSSGLVATINGFGDSFDNASYYADVFASACNNSALDVDSLSEAMSIAAPIFKTAGYTVEDAALYMGVMANNGIDASTAATSLKTGFARLVSPTAEASAALEELGISVTNADGSMKDTATIQEELHDAFAQLSESEQMAAASTIFGKNQMSSWLALINTAPSDVEELSESLSDCEGTTEAMAEAMMSGFGGSLEKLKSSIDVAVTSLGEALAPTISAVAEKIQNLVDWFNSLSEEQQQHIAKIMLMVAALGPLLVAGGKLTTGIGSLMKLAPKITGLVSSLSGGGSLLAGIGTKLTGIGTKLIAVVGGISAPVIAVVAAIAILVAAFKTLWDTNEEFREEILAIWDEIKTAFEEFGNGIVERLNALGFDFESFTDVLKAAWQGLCDFLAPIFTTVFSTIATVLSGALDVLMGIFDIFCGLFTGNWDLMWQGIQEVFSGIWNTIAELLSDAASRLLDTINMFLSNFDTSVQEILTNIANYFKNKLAEIQNTVTSKLTAIKSYFSTKFAEIKTSASTFFTNLKSSFTSGMTSLKSSITSKLNSIKTTFSNAWSAIKDAALTWGKDIIQGLIDGINAKLSALASAASNVADTIRGYLHFSVPDVGPLADADTYMPDFIDLLASGLEDNASKLADAASTAASMLVPVGATDTGTSSTIMSVANVDSIASMLAAYLPELAESKDVYLDGSKVTSYVNRQLGLAMR